jgi:undecaprenyl-phosphate 4-deoxy-4-formamido-L-arabinose transferase
MELSIVIPVYNSANILPELVKQIEFNLKNKINSFELFLVNDCSKDNSWNVIKDLCSKNSFIKGLNLKKNYGQHNSIMAGLNECKGNYIVLMDDDLQHPPNKINDIYLQLKKNFDVCYVNYIRRKHVWWKIFLSKSNNILSSFIFQNKPLHVYTSSFKGFNKKVLKKIIEYKKKEVFLDWLILNNTQNITIIDVDHFKRHEGETTYNIKNLLFLWSNMITIVPILPLRLSSPFLLFLKMFLKIFFYIFLKKNISEQFLISEYTYK